jgi:dTMP kinase
LRYEPVFIVFEGIDGAGKTSIAKALVKLLDSQGFQTLYTYEPFNDEMTELIKRYGRALGAVIETLLMAADRYYHVEEVIKPALSEGKIVVSDRYFYSSIAYQGARGADIQWIKTVNYFAIKPDIAFYLDVPPEVGLSRKKNGDTRISYLEEDIRTTEKVRAIYKQLVSEEGLIEIDASRSKCSVLRECVKEICRKKGLLCQAAVCGD